MEVRSGSSEKPLDVWILSRSRLGDLKQMESLAQAIGGRTTIKRLRFINNWLAIFPFLSAKLLDRVSRSQLAPPWPDLVLVAEGSAGPVALEIKRRSGGRSKAVCLGRPRGASTEFDLVITSPQYRLPDSPNILRLPLPLHSLDEARIAAASQALRQKRLDLPHPWIGLLIGGTSVPDQLTIGAASRLGAEAAAYAEKKSGTLFVVTSPRTGKTSEAALIAATPKAQHFPFRGSAGDDGYAAMLGLADELIVTSDSISMLTEAVMTGKSVSIYPLPQALGFEHRLTAKINRLAAGAGSASRLARALFDHGILELRPDRSALTRPLMDAGVIAMFGAAPRPKAVLQPSLALAVDRVRSLIKNPR